MLLSRNAVVPGGNESIANALVYCCPMSPLQEKDHPQCCAHGPTLPREDADTVQRSGASFASCQGHLDCTLGTQCCHGSLLLALQPSHACTSCSANELVDCSQQAPCLQCSRSCHCPRKQRLLVPWWQASCACIACGRCIVDSLHLCSCCQSSPAICGDGHLDTGHSSTMLFYR